MTYKYLRLHLSSRYRSRFASFLSPTFQFKNLLLLGVLCCFLKVTGCEGYVHAYDLKIYIHDHAHAHAHAQAHGRMFKASSTYKHLSSSSTSPNNNASKSKSTSCSLHATCKCIPSTLVRRGSVRMTRFALYSTPFYDDADFDWDADEDDEDFDLEFGSSASATTATATATAVLEKEDQDGYEGTRNEGGVKIQVQVDDDDDDMGRYSDSSDTVVGSRSRSGSDVTDEKSPKVDEELDDTDEAYYEKLFLQQSLAMETISSKEKTETESNTHKSEIFDENDGTLKSSNKIDPTVPKNDIESVSSKSEAHMDMEDMEDNNNNNMEEELHAIQREWKQKMLDMRNKSIHKRKLTRRNTQRKHLQDRATFLALRALRMQSQSQSQILDLSTNGAASGNVNGNYDVHVDAMTSTSTSTSIISTSKSMNHITQQYARPFPSLSQSSTRNYKRRGDDIYLQDNEHQLKLEQKLYGKRFKVAQQLYIRLLTTLDEMRLEAKEMASDLIADFIEEDVRLMIVKEVEEEQELALVGAGNGSGSGVKESVSYSSRLSSTSTSTANFNSSSSFRSQRSEDALRLNQKQQVRMSDILILSLNGHHIFATDSDSDDSEENEDLSDAGDAGGDTPLPHVDLNKVETKDLVAALRVRGNVKRRGRLPKSRSKVLEQLRQSYAQPLF